MYRDAFGLTNKPFGNTPDPAFFYFSTDHRQALITVGKGIRDRCGLMLLLGEVGTGKTTVCHHVHDHVGYTSTYLNNPYVSEVEFLEEVNRGLGISAGERSRRFLLTELKGYLLGQHHRGKPVVLIVDEAHRLGIPIFDQLLILSNFQVPRAHLLQIVLVGHPSILDTLRHPRLRSLNQRIDVRCHLGKMDYADTVDYVNFRLKRAGCADRSVFSAQALEAIWKASGGTPRLVNQLGERALNEAYLKGRRSIGKRAVKQVANDPLYQPLFVSKVKSWSARTALLGTVFSLFLGCSLGLWYFGVGSRFVPEMTRRVGHIPVEHRNFIRKPIAKLRFTEKTRNEATDAGAIFGGVTLPVLASGEARPVEPEFRPTQTTRRTAVPENFGERLGTRNQMLATDYLPDLTLSAIAWDEDPERCIAVVNEKLVHEGDFLGEVRVLRIKPDHIVLLHGADHIIKKIHTQEGDQSPETGDFQLDQEENKHRGSELDYQENAEQSLPLEDTRSIISFNYKTSELAPEACEELDRVVSLAKQSTNFDIVIFGYADNVGSPEYNKMLSKARANIVESYLVERGMNPERITTVGMGEKNPLMPNTTPEGRAANRRVEIQMVPAGV